MNDLSNERLAVLIQRFDVEFARFRGVADGETVVALRELQQSRDRLAGVEGAFRTALWMLERWEGSGLGRDAPSLAEETRNFLLSVSEQPR